LFFIFSISKMSTLMVQVEEKVTEVAVVLTCLWEKHLKIRDAAWAFPEKSSDSFVVIGLREFLEDSQRHERGRLKT